MNITITLINKTGLYMVNIPPIAKIGIANNGSCITKVSATIATRSKKT